MKKIKIIANYLPQYHSIPENDMWWGKGYTDWIAVKNAKPLYMNHKQPKAPLNDNYYDLSDINTIEWQAALAKKYEIYGFGIYHYWFSSKKQLLQKPAENLLHNKNIDINFMFIWDNGSWKRTWNKISDDQEKTYGIEINSKANGDENNIEVLAELIYGNEDEWKEHFEYLLPFFQDDRYIKIDGKPIFAFYQSRNDFKTIKKMASYWNELAIEHGLKGITCLSKDILYPVKLEKQMKYVPFQMTTPFIFLKYKILFKYYSINHKLAIFDYDKYWSDILFEAKHSSKNSYLCGLVNYDDTPRRGSKGKIISGATPEKFGKYMRQLIKISKKQNKEYVFLMAWNEWGEGSYLEPDKEYGYRYLEELKKAIDEK